MKRRTIDIWKTEKRIRADVVRAYMGRNDIPFAICFSCGNASRYLREAGVPRLDISPSGDLTANRWFTMEEIRRLFPHALDATSGHLPTDLMSEIADRLRAELSFDPDTEYVIPTGSGESAVCVKMAFPDVIFTPRYNDGGHATEYNEEAPLNGVVRAIFNKIEGL